MNRPPWQRCKKNGQDGKNNGRFATTAATASTEGTQKKTMPRIASELERCGVMHSQNAASLQLKIGSSNDRLSDSYSCDISKAANRKFKGAAKMRVEEKRNNDLRAWTMAKERNCTPFRVWDDIHEATATNGPDAFHKVQKLGYTVILDYKNLTYSAEGAPYNLFAPDNEPTQEQANFYKTGPPSAKAPPPMETIFEGVKINHSSYRFDPVKPTHAREGTELRASLKYGTSAYKAYQKLYKGQADDIIQKMFKNHT